VTRRFVADASIDVVCVHPHATDKTEALLQAIYDWAPAKAPRSMASAELTKSLNLGR
jgi:hypothetical protein